MPNRFGRQVGAVAPFKPDLLLPDGLLPVQRSTGSVAAELSSAADKLAGTLGRFADEAAALEGERAGRVAGLDPGFRPTGDTTVRGRAYEDAAIKTYQDNLDASVRTRMAEVFEANKNSPTALKAGLDRLRDDIDEKEVFPEIKGAFRASYARLRLPYELKASSNLDADVKDRSRGALIENITASQINAARMAAANPADAKTAAVVDGELKRMDGLIDEAVAGDVISAAAGATLKQKNRNEVVIRAALAQADALGSPEDVAAYRDNARKQFAAGKFKGLDAAGYDELDSKLEQTIRAKRTGANAGETLLQKNIGDLVSRATDGFPIPPDEWTRLASSEAAKTPRGEQIIAAGQAKLQIASLLRNRSVADGETLVATMRSELAKAGGATSGQAEIVTFAEQLVQQQRKDLNTDQLGLAEKKRLVPVVAPIDFQGFAASEDPAAGAALGSQIRARVAQARAVGTEFSRAPQFLRPEEKARLTEIVNQGGDKALQLAGAIVKGADTDAPAILREISSDAPLLAQAGTIIAEGGSLQAARDAFQARAVQASTGKALPGLEVAKAAPAARSEFGTAFLLQPEDQGRVRQAADAITQTRIARGGLDPKSGDAEKIYRRALQEAAGALFVDGVQFGGVADYKPGYWSTYKVAVPAGVRADAFRDVVRSIRDDELAALPIPPRAADGRPFLARDFAGATPIAVRGGYRFALGDLGSDDPKYIRGADGRPFVLPFEQLAPVLRSRVPGAFLGGR